MKIGIFGTGMVAQVVGGALMAGKHDVVFGTRDVAATMARTGKTGIGSDPFSEWAKGHPDAKLVTFKDAARHGSVLINATAGGGTLAALKSADAADLAGKLLIDIANPLDFSKGFPPFLSVCNTDSLAEQIQRAFPALKVVKSLNTVPAHLMISPAVIPGDHTIFVAGNDAGAKAQVQDLLTTWFGWKNSNILDLGDITAARGTEMYLALWIRLFAKTNNPMVTVHVVQGTSPH
jgi:8-hydroxy-5-deazaflavin:NADPH oxidoreductase